MKKTDSSPRRVMPIAILTSLLACFALSAVAIASSSVPAEKFDAQYLLPIDTDAWKAGRAAYDARDFERAVAYWQQVPTTHPEYPRSLRYIGWEVYADELGEPERALPYVHRCLAVDPFDGNTWQDLGRTYAALLGF